MQCGTILSCVEEQTSSAAEGGNQPRTYEIICNLPQAGQYPLRPDDRVLSCRAIDMCYCFATSFKYRTMKMISGELHNMDSCWVISIASCVCCKCVSINCKMRQLARCGVANMLRVLATLRRNKHAQEINACAGRPFAQRSIDRFSLFPHHLTALYIGYSMVNHWDV